MFQRMESSLLRKQGSGWLWAPHAATFHTLASFIDLHVAFLQEPLGVHEAVSGLEDLCMYYAVVSELTPVVSPAYIKKQAVLEDVVCSPLPFFEVHACHIDQTQPLGHIKKNPTLPRAPTDCVTVQN
jgi:hypothetical protein